MTDYLVYDVFTEAPFGGNPLAVVPQAYTLPERLLQPVAREFGFSETAFLYPPEAGGTARLRIFTPTQEIPFAGHPVIGSAVALADRGSPGGIVLETGAGPLPCFAADGRAGFVREVALDRLGDPEPALLADCLGLEPAAIRGAVHAPVIASAGLPFALVELQSARLLSRAHPRIEAFRAAAARHPLPFDFAIYAYVREGGDVRARMFAPLDDIPEDPATGSAAAALGLLLAGIEGSECRLTIRQGVEMGRPSTIEVIAEPGSVTISGGAVRVMEGRLADLAAAR